MFIVKTSTSDLYILKKLPKKLKYSQCNFLRATLKLFSKKNSNELTEENYPKNTLILCYGNVQSEENITKRDEYQNLIMWINDLSQILKVVEEE